MKVKQLLYIFALLMGIAAVSCNDDIDPWGDDANGGEEINFVFDLPAPLTRSLTGAKTSFENGDVIHISGKFTLQDNSTAIRYGALAYNSSTNKWTSVTNSMLTWPPTAVSGEFTAYHIPTLNISNAGLITDNNRNISLLQDVTVTSDPLYAFASVNRYGNAVNMRFSHLCTYLTLQNLTPAYDSFIFSAKSIAGSAASTEAIPFHNAFYLQLKENNELEFAFCTEPENLDPATITRTTVKHTDNPNVGDVSFFLEPGYYKEFTVSYPTGTTTSPFLNYQYVPLPDMDNNTPPMLNAGVAYSLNTTSSTGIVIESPSTNPDKPWPDDEEITVNVDEMLKAIANNQSYTENGKNIITKSGNTLTLNYNIDFEFVDYLYLSNNNLPNVPANVIFDGDNHTFHNLGCPLFNTNNGTITNLGINTVKAYNVELNQYANISGHGVQDFSRQGALCRVNNGRINKIRMTDVELTASVVTENDGDNESNQDTENVGLITGSNTGIIDNVRLAGTMLLTVKTSAKDTNGNSDCTLNAGGIVGQNTDSGTVNDIGSLSEGDGLQSVRVVNQCTSQLGAYYVGGVIGYNAGYVGTIGIPFIDVDCSASVCTKSFIGLVTGEITTSSKKTATIVGTNVSGRAAAGQIYPYFDLDSGSYIGGIAGASVLPEDGKGIAVTDCMIVAQMLDNSKANSPDIINCTGGCFGRIYTPFTVEEITLNLRALRYPGESAVANWYAGTFAGFGVTGQQWTWRLTNNTGISASIGSYTLVD